MEQNKLLLRFRVYILIDTDLKEVDTTWNLNRDEENYGNMERQMSIKDNMFPEQLLFRNLEEMSSQNVVKAYEHLNNDLKRSEPL